MVRETRHLWVGNLPENVREEKIIEHFKRMLRSEARASKSDQSALNMLSSRH